MPKNNTNPAAGVAPEPVARAIADKATAAPPQADGKKFVSIGKRAHNELTYRGVDFLLNSAIGVAFTYWTKRTASGAKWFGKPVTDFFRSALKPIVKSPAALETGAHWGAMFTSIIVGGTAIITPMIALEKKKNKKAIITYVNEKMHGEEKVEADPRFAQELEHIDNEPKKNFAIGMAARIIVLVPMIVATINKRANDQMLKYLYNPVAKGSKALSKAIGLQPKQLMNRMLPEPTGEMISDWDFIHRTIGFDLGLTFIYCFAHEAVIKGLAAAGFKNTQPNMDTQTPSTETLPVLASTDAAPLRETHRDRPSPTLNVAEYTARPPMEASPVL